MGNSFLSTVDNRLSTWIDIKNKQQKNGQQAVQKTITLSRQYGCEAFPIAEKLKEMAEKLSKESWNIYDRTLIEKVSTDHNLSMNLLEKLGDESSVLDILSGIIPDWPSHETAFVKVSKALIEVARGGNAIIVGRGGAILTQNIKHCYHFRLEAPFEYRVQSIAKRKNLSLKEAEADVKTNQQNREKFIDNQLHVSVKDIRFYNAIFNNSKNINSQIEKSIIQYVFE